MYFLTGPMFCELSIEGHFDTGMHGTYFLLKYLMEADRNDLVYLMTNTREYPGWGYMLANGATTSWESWRGQLHIHDTLIYRRLVH